MLIDLNFNGEYTLDKVVEIPAEYYRDSDIIALSKIKIEGKIFYDEENSVRIKSLISGDMTIKDSISNEDVLYPFSITYDDTIPENLKKMNEKLDLFEFLWENIVLEVPIRFTKETDLSKFSGDGWKLISEEDKVSNNPFGDLLKDFDKKE